MCRAAITSRLYAFHHETPRKQRIFIPVASRGYCRCPLNGMGLLSDGQMDINILSRDAHFFPHPPLSRAVHFSPRNRESLLRHSLSCDSYLLIRLMKSRFALHTNYNVVVPLQLKSHDHLSVSSASGFLNRRQMPAMESVIEIIRRAGSPSLSHLMYYVYDIYVGKYFAAKSVAGREVYAFFMTRKRSRPASGSRVLLLCPIKL